MTSKNVSLVFNTGINSGVLFMKLDRLREFEFGKKMAKVAFDDFYRKQYDLYGNQIIMGLLFRNQSGKQNFAYFFCK